MALRPEPADFFAGNFISLFAGGGGIDLGLRILAPAARCVCYVEREIPAAGILAARMADGALHDAPVWSDVCTFDGRPWRGLVDGIVGGFPCQDLSVAGKRAGIQRGNRSGLFYEYARIIREVQPRWVAIENVRAVLFFPAGGIVLGELASMGFDAEWGSLEACDVGASHERHRKFILAYRRGGRPAQRDRGFGVKWDGVVDGGEAVDNADRFRSGTRWSRHHGSDEWNVADADGGDVGHAAHGRRDDASASRGCDESEGPAGGSGVDVADAGHESVRWRAGRGEAVGGRACITPAGSGVELGYADDAGLEGRRHVAGGCADERAAGAAGVRVGSWALGPADARWADVLVRYPWLRPALSQAEAESDVCRVADGLATVLDGRIDRLRACGNGVVPLQFAAAFAELARRACAAGGC